MRINPRMDVVEAVLTSQDMVKHKLYITIQGLAAKM